MAFRWKVPRAELSLMLLWTYAMLPGLAFLPVYFPSDCSHSSSIVPLHLAKSIKSQPAAKVKKNPRLRKFEKMLPRLVSYKEKYGHTQVNPDVDGDLCKWTRQIRNTYRHQALNMTSFSSSLSSKKLARAKLEALNELGFDWGTNQKMEVPKRRRFDEMVLRLKAYKKKHGHVEVRKEDDEDLYVWTRNLRYNYQWQVQKRDDPTRQRRRLSAQKLQQLENLGFSWETNRNGNRWPRMMRALSAYKKKYGTSVVDRNIDEELYKWTQQLLCNYRHQALNLTDNSSGSSSKHRRPRLAVNKMKELNDIGFDWAPPQRRQFLRWNDMIERLQVFYLEHGHARVPVDYEDQDLYRWTRNVVTNYGRQLRNSTSAETCDDLNRHFLSQRRLQQLQELNFDWERRSSSWDQYYKDLCEYKKKNGHCHVSSLENRTLSNFIQRQRREFRKYLSGGTTTLTPDRLEALRRIKFEWARSHDNLWNERLQDLEAFVMRSGSANVPQEYDRNFQLGQWTMNQRTKYRRRRQGQQSSMTEKRIRELEKLDFHWNRHEMRWNAMWQRLRDYKEEYGHMLISSSDVENSDLRQWFNLQRYLKRISKLSKERIRKLEEIPDFSWRRPRGTGPSKEDWSKLFVAIREKGIRPGTRARQHWFDGTDRFADVKTEYSEDELLALWNEEDDEDEDEDEYFEDEESRLFLRA